MADKEATVYIIDVGRSMSRTRNGRSESDLELAMRWIWDKLTSVIATERKTLLQGVVALRTDDTNNDLGAQDGYQHISVLHELSQLLLGDLKALRRDIQPSNTDKGDAISALALAISLIDRTCKRLKYKRKIVLVTNGEGLMDIGDLDDISKKISQDGIELTIIGVDFDDADYGFTEEEKSPTKRQNEEIFRKFAEDCGGVFGTLQQAVDELGEPRLKETRPVPSYRGNLTLGDLRTYPDTAMVIDVERYPRTMIRRPPTASSFAVATDSVRQRDYASSSGQAMEVSTEAEGQPGDDLVQIRNQISYFIDDADAPDGKRRVERDDLARGYEYGRTAVHINEIDEGITKLETSIGLEILGFIPWVNYDRFMSMSNTHVVVASRANSKAIMALSSFIHTLHELESYAIARLVTKDGKEPSIEALAPSIEPNFECLTSVNLPFAEDVRPYKFPPLDKVMTVSGKTLKEHRFIPNQDLQSAMNDYVDMMDLSAFGKDESGDSIDFLTIQDSFSPVLHHIDQAVRWRAVHPDAPLPAPYESLIRYRNPPRELIEDAQRSLKKLVGAADVKKVPPKFVGRRQGRKDQPKPLSGLDLDSLLGVSSKRAVDPNNSIPSLRQMLNVADDASVIDDAAKQMGAIIEKRITASFGDTSYEQVLEEMRVFRDEMKEMEEPALWNSFAKGLKKKLLNDELGEGRGELWFIIRRARLGLHEGKFPGGGETTSEEADKFLRPRYEV